MFTLYSKIILIIPSIRFSFSHFFNGKNLKAKTLIVPIVRAFSIVPECYPDWDEEGRENVKGRYVIRRQQTECHIVYCIACRTHAQWAKVVFSSI
jgi:hypothetical protein